jgi:protein-tyrosine phosphatase
VIDLHSHLLPGIDDGPSTMDGTLRMAEVAVAAGITLMACTPHMAEPYPVAPERMHEAVAATRAALADAGIPLEIVPGAEIALDWVTRMDDAALRASTLGGTGRHLLLEMPFRGWPLQLPELLDGLDVRGFRAVMAHPERAESVQREPARMRDVVGRGALVQITAGSLTGEHGRMARQTAATLLRNGLVHVIASDAHRHDRRPPGLADALGAAARILRCEPEDLRWMVEDGPGQVLAGAVVRPPRLGVPPPPPRSQAPAAGPRRPGRGGRPSGRAPGRPRGSQTSR